MIKTGEIDKIAGREGVRATQIQKDYAVSWILWGISQNDFLKENLIFKGGTCLKKVYYSDYRFSEDMDFTLADDTISNDEVIKNFESLCKEVFNVSRIKLEITGSSFDIHESSGSIVFKIDFKGPYGFDSIKVDITRGEIILFGTERRPIFKTYSDLEQEDVIIIKTYSLKEIFIEKIIAIMGRTIPRDIFDLHFLTEVENIELEDVYREFIIKAENKGQNPKRLFDKVKQKEATLKRDWEKNLINQMKKGELPEFEDVWRKSNRTLKKLMRLLNK